MSAITGIGETRTISQPADASAAICAVVASTSCVFVSVIDCTTTGAPPPILTPPTEICRALPIPRVSVTLTLGGSPYVVGEADHEEHEHERDPDHGDPFVERAAERAPPDPLDDREGDVPAVERQEREQVQERQREADQAEHENEVAEALVERLRGHLGDPHRARDLASALPPRQSREEEGDLL